MPLEMINKTMGKKELGNLVNECYRLSGPKATVLLADALRSMGYRYSTKAGLSIAIKDMVIPNSKKKFLDAAYEEVKKIKEQYSEGLLTEGERYNKVIDIWAKVTESIAGEMFSGIAKMKKKDFKGKEHEVPSTNSIFMMADSGARGSAQQIRQLAGMRGLMAKPRERSLKLLLLQILGKAYRFFSTSHRLTVLEKGWQIRHLRPRVQVI